MNNKIRSAFTMACMTAGMLISTQNGAAINFKQSANQESKQEDEREEHKPLPEGCSKVSTKDDRAKACRAYLKLKSLEYSHEDCMKMLNLIRCVKINEYNEWVDKVNATSVKNDEPNGESGEGDKKEDKDPVTAFCDRLADGSRSKKMACLNFFSGADLNFFGKRFLAGMCPAEKVSSNTEGMEPSDEDSNAPGRKDGPNEDEGNMYKMCESILEQEKNAQD